MDNCEISKMFGHVKNWEGQIRSGIWDKTSAGAFIKWLYFAVLNKPVPKIRTLQNPLACEVEATKFSQKYLGKLLKIDRILFKTIFCRIRDILLRLKDGPVTLCKIFTHIEAEFGILEDPSWPSRIYESRFYDGAFPTQLSIELAKVLHPFFKYSITPTILNAPFNCAYAYYSPILPADIREFLLSLEKGKLGFLLAFERVAFISPPPRIGDGMAIWPDGWQVNFRPSNRDRIPVTDLLSIGMFEGAIRVFVKDIPVIACRYSIVQCAPTIDASTMDEILQEYALPEHHQRNLAKRCRLSRAEEMFVHASNLQAWAEHSYDVDLIDSRLAFPILRHLRHFDKVANNAYLHAVHERWSAGNATSRHVLEEIAPDAINELRARNHLC